MRLALWLAVWMWLGGWVGTLQADGPAVTYYVQLVWGTNREKPKEAKFKPVGPKLSEKLANVYQWKKYWEVNCQKTNVSVGKPANVTLSKDCRVEIEFVNPTQRQVRMYGKGRLVIKAQRKISDHSMSFHGGDIEAGGSWFVVIREDEPKYEKGVAD